MAIIRTGGLIAAISGDLGSTNYAITRYGQVARRKLHRTKKYSKLQLDRRIRLLEVQKAWRDMTDLERHAWNTSAAVYKRNNRLGVSRHMSGWQMFLAYNLFWRGTLPRVLLLPPDPQNAAPISNLSLTFTEGGPYTVSFHNSDLGMVRYLYIYGINSISAKPRTHWSFWNYIRDDVITGKTSLNLFPVWNFLLPPPTAGQNVAVKCVTFRYTQMPSSPVIASTIVLP